jgi:hypothetical protein
LFASTSCRWEAAPYFNNPSCKTQYVKKERQEKNSHKNPEIVKKEVKHK